MNALPALNLGGIRSFPPGRMVEIEALRRFGAELN